jgi:threonine synthase
MDVGHPSNFDRMLWLYKGSVEAMRRDLVGVRCTDDEVRRTIREVFERAGYVLDPHSAIGYRGLKDTFGSGMFLGTAHPAKFSEIVEPIVGRKIDRPPALAAALSRSRHVVKIDATYEAVRDVLAR